MKKSWSKTAPLISPPTALALLKTCTNKDGGKKKGFSLPTKQSSCTTSVREPLKVWHTSNKLRACAQHQSLSTFQGESNWYYYATWLIDASEALLVSMQSDYASRDAEICVHRRSFPFIATLTFQFANTVLANQNLHWIENQFLIADLKLLPFNCQTWVLQVQSAAPKLWANKIWLR